MSTEELIMEFKAEDRAPHSDIENIRSDTSTISASEGDSRCCSSSTPPLFYKLKRPRVLIKKLSHEVLAKHNIAIEKGHMSTFHSSRSSGRLKGKQKQDGQYLALHVNKPLSEILNKKNRARQIQMNPTRSKAKENETKLTCKKIMGYKRNGGGLDANLFSKSSYKKQTCVKTSSTRETYTHIQQNVVGKNIETSPIIGERSGALVTSNSINVNLIKRSSYERRSLHEKIAATRLKQSPSSSTLNHYPDMKSKYHLPKKALPSSHNNSSVTNTPVNNLHIKRDKPNTIMSNNHIQKPNMLPNPQHLNVQHPLPFGSTKCPNNQNTILTPIRHHQKNSSGLVYKTNNSTPRTFTIKAFKIPHNSSVTNASVQVETPKVFIINHPPSGIEPLDTPSSSLNQKFTARQQNRNDKHEDILTCIDSETELELSDCEKQTEPEVIKRIIYHSKSVQTKFTCNSSICGLVDSDEFKLNCFYCYDIFPLHKWSEFKKHIKVVHHVQEREHQSDSDPAISISENDTHINSRNNNITEAVESINKTINNNDISLSKEKLIRKEIKAEQVSKLALEAKFAAKRLNATSKSPFKLSSFMPTALYSNELNKSKGLQKSCRTKQDHSSSCMDQIINLESDGYDLYTTHTDTATKSNLKNLNLDKSTTENKASPNDTWHVPTLPHITIKKLNRLLPKESIKSDKPASQHCNKVFSNLNIQKVIKTVPKATVQQSSDEDRKPRYFVVKKIIKLPTTDDSVQNLNISKGTLLTKMVKTKKGTTNKSDCEEFSFNREAKSVVAKDVNEDGVVFGVSNSRLVIEFLLKLRTYPNLWISQAENDVTNNYCESIKQLSSHLNSRFNSNITEIQVQRSIERIKNWYCRTVNEVNEHNKNMNNTEPYKHEFPIYFRILQNLFKSDIQNGNAAIYNSPVKSSVPKENDVVYKTRVETSGVGNIRSKEHALYSQEPKSFDVTSFKPLVVPSCTDKNEIIERTGESLIEFDADTLYDNESSDEEVLEEFDETKLLKKKKLPKIYVGSYECEICRKNYKRICDLKRHKVFHFPPAFHCSICSKRFYFKHWAERCTHVEKSKYKRVDKDPSKPKKIWPKKVFRFKMICEICGASYRSIASLNTHKKDKHLNQRHKCIVCNFTALSNWRIVQHQRKRHIVELGTIEEVAKKSRPRTDTKTPFSNEARQGFFWRLEMRKKLKPGEIFYGCCRCKIVFNSRKEKVYHNKIEHPITETTVVCLLCLPSNIQLLSNTNSARRHYTDIHKVAWYEIDGLVKRTKPIFKLVEKEDIELLKASANYKDLLEQLFRDKKLEPVQALQTVNDETLEAVHNLPSPIIRKEMEQNVKKIDMESTVAEEETVFVDGIIDHDYNCGEKFNENEYTNRYEHNYSDEKENAENYNEYHEPVNNQLENLLYYDTRSVSSANDIESNDNEMHYDQEYIEGIELVEETIVEEEYIDEVNEYF